MTVSVSSLSLISLWKYVFLASKFHQDRSWSPSSGRRRSFGILMGILSQVLLEFFWPLREETLRRGKKELWKFSLHSFFLSTTSQQLEHNDSSFLFPWFTLCEWFHRCQMPDFMLSYSVIVSVLVELNWLKFGEHVKYLTLAYRSHLSECFF